MTDESCEREQYLEHEVSLSGFVVRYGGSVIEVLSGRLEERAELNVQLLINVRLEEGRTAEELGVLLDAPSLAEQIVGAPPAAPRTVLWESAAKR